MTTQIAPQNRVLAYVKEVRKETDIRSIVELLNTGKWIVINGLLHENVFHALMGRVED